MVTFGSDIHVPQRMNPYDFGGALILPPSSGVTTNSPVLGYSSVLVQHFVKQSSASAPTRASNLFYKN